ncbi:Sulfotransferase domain protein [Hydrogenophaga sp. T4]|nr:Sulfotransferase domain protein [Hydrogenophaga sp. T4]
MNSIKKIKGYVFSVPKAGTYLMSEFLQQIGSQSTGWHISLNQYLDTLHFDNLTNKQTPSQTKKERIYIASFRQIPVGKHAFGHLSPLYVPPPILQRDYKILCAKRNPKEVLISEFIDFRYRRSDVAFVSKKNVPDSIKAFEIYMTDHAHVIKNICQNFVLLEEMAVNPIYQSLVGDQSFYFLDFKKFLSSEQGPEIARKVSDFFGAHLTPEGAKMAWQAALDADNKTKSADAEIDIPRDQFWSSVASQVYTQLGFPELSSRLGY